MQKFADADPYFLNGLVTRVKVREWSVVVNSSTTQDPNGGGAGNGDGMSAPELDVLPVLNADSWTVLFASTTALSLVLFTTVFTSS